MFFKAFFVILPIVRFLGSDPKTGQQDDWGRGHLFRSGRSGYVPITRGYLRTFSSSSNNHPFDASSNSNYERNSGFDIPIHKNVEYTLYNKVCECFNKGQ